MSVLEESMRTLVDAASLNYLAKHQRKAPAQSMLEFSPAIYLPSIPLV